MALLSEKNTKEITEYVRHKVILSNSSFYNKINQSFDAIIAIFSQAKYLCTSIIHQMVKCIPMVFGVLIKSCMHI